MSSRFGVGVVALAALLAFPARADEMFVDRAVVSFVAPETGGLAHPQFVFERELAFEARLEALSDPDRGGLDDAPYRERHVTAALDRHVAETVLATLRIEPEPTPAELANGTELARRMISDRAGGEDALDVARRAEGISEHELLRLLEKKARSSLYLDRMVTPMLRPSDAELRSIHKATANPFQSLPFDAARPALLRWYVSRRLSSALVAFFENARSRIDVTVL
jgi:hypothetical protein